LHLIQGLCRGIAHPCFFVWVSIVCWFLQFLCLISLSFCNALLYSGLFSLQNDPSITHELAHRNIDHTKDIQPISLPYGGGGQYEFAFKDIAPYIVQGDVKSTKNSFRFVVHDKHIGMSDYNSEYFVHTKVPLCNIIHHLSVKVILNIACVHGIKISSHIPKAIMVNIFDAHHCATCNDAITIFSVVRSKLVRERNRKRKAMDSACVKPEMTGGTGDSVQQEYISTTEIKQKSRQGTNRS